MKNGMNRSLSKSNLSSNTFQLALMALLADMGLMSKRIIGPVANIITDSLHIPGGICTGFSLMFLVLAVRLVSVRYAGVKMSFIQSVTALILGRVGSMGALSVVGYVLPGLIIDLTATYAQYADIPQVEYFVLANIFSSVMAAITANFIVFGMKGWLLVLYLAVASMTGLLCGLLGWKIFQKFPSTLKSAK